MPHLRIENKYFRVPEFLEFTGKSEFRLLMFLIANIVRGNADGYIPHGAERIHKAFYQKGILCASYSEINIAKYFGWKSKSYVSKLVHNLEQMNMLHIESIPTYSGNRNVYQLGFYKGIYGNKGYKETLFFDVYFSGLAEIHQANQVDNRIQRYMPDCSQEYLEKINNKLISMVKKMKTLY